jgi:WD40 repeat protein
VHAVGFAPGGGLLATGGKQIVKHCLIVWDLTDPAHPTRTASVPVGSDSIVHALGFNSDGRLLASCSDHSVYLDFGTGGLALQDSAVMLWDLIDLPRPTRTATLQQRGGTRMAPTRRQRHAMGTTLTGHSGTPRALSFSPYGRLLATGSDDRTTPIWDVADPAQPACTAILTHSQPVPAVAFSPDGRLLVTGSGTTVQIWQIN